MLKIALILVLANTGGARNEYTTVYFNTMDECLASLKETKITFPAPSAADDNTWAGYATCGYKTSD